MDPREVLVTRRQLVEWLGSPRAKDWERIKITDPAKPEIQAIDELRSTLVGAQCFYVSPEMTVVARHAAKTMPDQKPLAQDFPGPRGFIVWEGPLADEDEIAAMMKMRGVSEDPRLISRTVSWQLTTQMGVPGAEITHWIHGDQITVPPLLPIETGFWNFTESIRTSPGWDTWGEERAPEIRYKAHVLMTIYTTMVLMGQTISAAEKVQGDRSEARRAARAEIPVSEVTVVKLRKRERSAETPEPSGPVNWQRRWIVDSHWRQQWYPSLNDHRAILILPYVKGPEDKPLVMNEQVGDWAR